MFKKLEQVLAILYRPIESKNIDSYRIEPYEPHPTKAEKMLECTMDIAVGAMVFFYHFERRLAIDSRLYSLRQEKEARATSIKNGGGMG